MCAHVRDHLRAEESLQPDAIFAEIVHLPEGRLGNILTRPILREYEIPYLGKPGVLPDRQIPIADPLVSVAGDPVALRSARPGRVIPWRTRTHNYATSQGSTIRRRRAAPRRPPPDPRAGLTARSATRTMLSWRAPVPPEQHPESEDCSTCHVEYYLPTTRDLFAAQSQISPYSADRDSRGVESQSAPDNEEPYPLHSKNPRARIDRGESVESREGAQEKRLWPSAKAP